MAIAIALPRFNDIGSSVTPIFLLMNHFSVPIFYVKRKNEETLSIRGLIFFFQMRHRVPFFLALRLKF